MRLLRLALTELIIRFGNLTYDSIRASKRDRRACPALLRIRPVRARRRVRQPHHQSDGVVSQPGDAGAGIILPTAIPSLVGDSHDSGEYLRALHRAGFPDARGI